ncbi:condensation domain-containing protein [Streptomyces sp. NPDC032940]|uniref:condensation domain-containing protein n=1 Tax=Streptomyces sp. NPDC032940 TaxID=3155366 RepID=UPI00340D62CB
MTTQASHPHGAEGEGHQADGRSRREELAERLGRPGTSAAVTGAPRIVPASSGQRGLWFLEQIAPKTAAYVETAAIDLAGPYDTAALRSALADVVDGQAALRTACVTGRSGPVQLVHPPGTVTVPLHESTHPGDPDDPHTLRARLEHDGMLEPFDLGRAPLLRARLYRVSPTRATLVLAVHHIVWDGASMGVLLADLTAAYEARSTGRTDTTHRTGPDYTDLTLAERGRESDAGHRASLDHWAELLHGAPVTALPATAGPGDTPQEAGAVPRRSGVVRRSVPAPTVERLRARANEAGCTMFMMGIACLTAALRPGPAPLPVLVAAPMSVRPPGAERLIGYLTNTVPVLVTPPPGSSRRVFLEEVRRSCVRSWTHRAVPLEDIVAAAAPARTAGHPPFADVLFNYTALPEPVRDATGLTWQAHWLPSPSPRCALLVSWNESQGRLLVRLEHDPGRLTAGTANAVADALLAVAEHLAEADDIPYDALPALASPPLPAPAAAEQAGRPGTGRPGARTVTSGVRAAAAQVWREALGLDETDELDDEDDFFELGGRSLDAARIATKLSAALGRDVSLRTVLDTESFGEFLAQVELAPTTATKGA